MRKTKIVCTLGPASADEKVMEAMLRAGMNVARFNFSHGTHESHREMMQRFRAVRDRLGVAAAVMLDTKGPEIRLKDMAGGEAMLADGAEFTLLDSFPILNCSCFITSSLSRESSFDILPEMPWLLAESLFIVMSPNSRGG